MSQVNLNSVATGSTKGDSIVIELDPVPDIGDSLRRFSSLPNCALLESSRAVSSARGQQLGRYSFLTADPVQWIEVSGVDSSDESALKQLQICLELHASESLPGLPPFQGGLAGMLSYELNRNLEKVPAAKFDEFKIPQISFGLFDCVVAWDHHLNRAWIISTGIPEVESHRKAERAKLRAEEFLDRLTSTDFHPPRSKSEALPEPISLEAESYPIKRLSGLASDFSEEQYIAAVKKTIDYINAGDVFQINLSQRLVLPANCDSVTLYERLRKRNAAPFSAYLDLGHWQIASASPERLVSIRDRNVEARPIKGTRKRTRFPVVDIDSGINLKTSEKDLAENTMIVDLMRNDLSRVCEDDSILVSQLCELEEYESVLHLVSAVEGRLRPDKNVCDVIRAIFPGGSITGAPKVRAMEIISELEPTARGAYCGSLGYIGLDGTADFNILIRTITASQGWWQIPVGGGIVAQSDPQQEYEETWTKAAGMLRATSP